MGSKTMYKEPATEWNQAQPLGNGSVGAMVFGGVEKEKICLNSDTLWSGRPGRIFLDNAKAAWEKARKAALKGDYRKAHDLINESCLGKRGEVYLTFGDMDISFFDINGSINGYSRTLDLEKSLLTVQFEADRVSYKREYFVSYPDDVMVMKFSADEPGKISFETELSSPLKYKTKLFDNAIYIEGECPGFTREDENCNPVYEYPELPEEKGIAFCGGFKLITAGSSAVCGRSENKITVKNADEAVIIFSIKTSFNGFDKLPFTEGREYKNALKETLEAAEGLGCDKLLERHINDYTELFGRTRLYLGESGREDMPTDERLEKFGQEQDDISLYTLLFDFGRYLAISSVREGTQIANLQGIWNNSMNPPWRSNYTLNINAEMNQWPLLMCGLNECFMPFVEFMKGINKSGVHAAKTIYGVRGISMPSNTDIWLKPTPNFGDARFAFWEGATGWLCRSLYEYYEYTQDTEYLKETCYPIMKNAALFYMDILCDRGDGYFSVCPSTSPENGFLYETEAGKKVNAAVAKYTTMTDSIVYDLFTNCVNTIEIINSDNSEDIEFKNQLENILGKMKPFAIGKDGRLLEWNEDFEETEVNHRHISHLYALHPANLITPEKTPELAGACRKTLEKRGDGGTGWSLAWKVNFFARLNDGNHALKLIDMMLKLVDAKEISYEADGGIYPNMFDAHPPFQIDGNFGVVSGIIEMLVRCDGDDVRLLPALPDKWKNGKLTGVRIKGSKVFDIEWKNGKLTSVAERENN